MSDREVHGCARRRCNDSGASSPPARVTSKAASPVAAVISAHGAGEARQIV